MPIIDPSIDIVFPHGLLAIVKVLHLRGETVHVTLSGLVVLTAGQSESLES